MGFSIADGPTSNGRGPEPGECDVDGRRCAAASNPAGGAAFLRQRDHSRSHRRFTNESKEAAAIAGRWDADGSKLDVQLSSDGMQIAALKRQISVAGIPLLGNATSGTWKGDLRYRGDASDRAAEAGLEN